MKINKFTYFSYLSIKENLLLPLNKFLSNREVLEISRNMKYSNQFFPIPFFLSANDSDLKEINNGFLNLYYKTKFVGSIKVKSVSFFDKETIIKSLFPLKARNNEHPFKNFINQSGEFLIETEKFVNSKKKIKNKNFIGFATRNVPHRGHEKIVRKFSKKKKLIVHIFEDSSNNKKINSNKSFLAYKKLLKKNKLNGKVLLKKIKLPSFLLGPKQAALHAIVGKNLSCNAFIIGRDHSGYKDFYGEFDSIKFCKRYQNKIGIKIVDSGSPIFCKTLKKVLFRKDCICGKFIDISATLIRKTKKKKLKKLLKISHDK